MPIRRSLGSSQYHHIFVKDVLEYGLEGAIILSNVSGVQDEEGCLVKFDDLYRYFPYIPKEIFYKKLNELIEKGLLERIEVNNE